MNHCDILWVDDFDTSDNIADSELVTNDTSDTATFKNELNDYYPMSYHFRVNIYKYFLKLLLHLEDDFSQYNCVVLDINLGKGIWRSRKPSVLPYRYKKPLNATEELLKIKKILEQNNVQLREKDCYRDSEGKLVISSSSFFENAGYYLYLYLLQKGMPAERICMLTGNAGPKNTSSEWDDLFKQAGLIPPKTFDRKDEKGNNSKFAKWLDERFSNEYRFRSCVIAMSGCLLDMIAKNGIKLRQFWNEVWEDDEDGIESVRHILENVRKFPLRFSKGIENECFNIIWQLVLPWEGIKTSVNYLYETNKDDRYYIFFKAIRNYLAHRSITKVGIQVSAFLFGLSLHGLFDFTSVDSKVKRNYEEYKLWEKELLKLMHNIDEENQHQEEIKFSELSLQSFNCFCESYKLTNKDKINFDYKSNNEIKVYKSIIEIIKKIDLKFFKDVDLPRLFLQCLYEVDGTRKPDDELKLDNSFKNRTIIIYKSQDRFSFYKCNSDNLDRIEDKYLDGVKNTLKKKIYDDLLDIENRKKELKNKK